MPAGAIHAQLGLPVARAADGYAPEAYAALAESPDAAVDWVGRDDWEVLDFNLDNPHLADVRVRRAIAHGVNRVEIITALFGGQAGLMRSYLPPGHPLYAGDEALPDYAFDLEQARGLLAEAGYDLSGFPATHPDKGALVLRLESMDIAPHSRVQIADLLKAQLAQVGIELETSFNALPAFEAADCSGIRNGRRFDLALAGWIGGLPRYPFQWVQQMTASDSIPAPSNGCPITSANWTGWSNSGADALLPALGDGRLALEQPETYRAKWAEHQQLWANDLPSVPLFNLWRPVTYVETLQGIRVRPLNFGGPFVDTWNIAEWALR
jgi:peptide/nickel transport system substrate-binding protein